MSIYTDGRLKRVMARFIDLQSREAYLSDRFTYLGDASAGSYDVPSIAASVIGTTRVRSAPGVDTLTPNNMPLNQEPALKSLLPHRDPESLLEGNYFEALAEQKFFEIRNEVDTDLADQLWKVSAAAAAGSNAVANDGGNVQNAALASLTLKMVGDAEADLVANGYQRSRFMWALSPKAFAAFRTLSDVVPSFSRAEMADLGVPNASAFMTVHGIPCIETPGLPNSISVAGTATQEADDEVITATVTAGHGLQTGMVGTITGATIADTTASAFTVNAAGTTVTTVGNAIGADISSEAVTLLVDAGVAVLFDRTKAFYGGDLVPSVRVVPDSESISDVLQIGIKYGRYVYEGASRVLLVP